MHRRRAPYVPANARPRMHLPGGARLALHAIVNVETWLLDERLPRQVLTAPAGVQPIPDVPNFAWYEYGMRVGFWRVLEVLGEHGVRATLSVNAAVCDDYPEIVRAASDAGWEMMAHGYHQRAMSVVARRARGRPPGARAFGRGDGDAPARLAGTRPGRDVGDAGGPASRRGSRTAATGARPTICPTTSTSRAVR